MAEPNGSPQYYVNRLAVGKIKNKVDEQILRTLFHAVRSGNVHTVRELLQQGINVNSVFLTDGAKGKPRHHHDPKILDGNLYSPADFNCLGDSLLHHAAAAGQTDMCRMLITEWKADVDIRNPIGNTPLHVAAKERLPEICQVLLKAGEAKVNAKNDDGERPLHIAAACNAIGVCRVLIKDSKVNVNAQNKLFNTPLHRAVDEDNHEMCKILIKEGKVDVNLQNKWGTPLHRAAGNNQTEICRILIKDGDAKVDIKNKFGDTPLYRAAYEKACDSCRVLIQDGQARVNKRNHEGDTPLHAAAEQNCQSVCEVLITVGEANVNIRNKVGDTPLHKAIRRNHILAAKALLELGFADTDIRNSDDKTVLDYKIKKAKDAEIVRNAFKKLATHRKMAETDGCVDCANLFMCGNPEAGKTTLVNSLSKGFFSSIRAARKESDHDYHPTPGIRVKTKHIRGAGDFVIWDMAGQVEHHVTHAMFLAKSKGIFILVYDVTSESCIIELLDWLRFLKSGHDPQGAKPKPKVIIVGSHYDLVKHKHIALKKAQSTVNKLVKQFEPFLDIHMDAILLDARKRTGQEMAELKTVLQGMARPLKGEQMPRICSQISKYMLLWCTSGDIPLLRWTEFVEMVKELDQLANSDFINRAVGFLHDTGKLFHAQIANPDIDDILILNTDWLNSKIFSPIFAPNNPDLKQPGLENKQEYTMEDIADHIDVQDPELIVTLLQHFELAYCYQRKEVRAFIIPAKLPPGVEDIHWQTNDPAYTRYTGLRIECLDDTDRLSADVFPCIQVCLMSRYLQEGISPKLSNHGLKICDKVEGMIQLTKDRRAIHIAVRETQLTQKEDAKKQILEMKDLVLSELRLRSNGTRLNICHLSSVALSSSPDLVSKLYWFHETDVEEAERKRLSLVVCGKLVHETVESVKGCLAENQSDRGCLAENQGDRGCLAENQGDRGCLAENQGVRGCLAENQGDNQGDKGCLAENQEHTYVNIDALRNLASAYLSSPSMPATRVNEILHVNQDTSDQRQLYHNYSGTSTASNNSLPNILLADEGEARRIFVKQRSASNVIELTSDFSPAHPNRQLSLPTISTSCPRSCSQQSMSKLALQPNQLLNSINPLKRNEAHLLRNNCCGLRCGWECIPREISRQLYQILDEPHPLKRDYHAMAEAFGLTKRSLEQIENYQLRDMSITAAIVKIVYQQRIQIRTYLSIEEVLTIVKHPGIVGNEEAAKLIEDYLHITTPWTPYILDFGISDRVLLHRAMLTQTRYSIRRLLKASDLIECLEGHLTEDDIDEVRKCEGDKTYNCSNAMDLLMYKLIQLKDAEWYQTFLDAILSLGQSLPAEILEQKRRELLRHPAFSMLTRNDEAVVGASGGEHEELDPGPTMTIDDRFKLTNPSPLSRGAAQGSYESQTFHNETDC